MAEETPAAAGHAETPKKGGGAVKLILVAVIAALLTAGAAVAVFFMLGEKQPDAEHADEASDGGDQGDEHGKKKKKKKKKGDGEEHPPTYFKLEQMTVNLAGGKDHFLATNLELRLGEPEAEKLLSARMPEVKNLVLLTLSAQTPEALSNLEGKTALAQKLRDDLNALIDQDEDTGVADVFFTPFINQ